MLELNLQLKFWHLKISICVTGSNLTVMDRQPNGTRCSCEGTDELRSRCQCHTWSEGYVINSLKKNNQDFSLPIWKLMFKLLKWTFQDGATPLFKAAHKGHEDVVEALLCGRPSLGLCRNGESALHAACLFGHLAVVQALVMAGAHIGLRNKVEWCIQWFLPTWNR